MYLDTKEEVDRLLAKMAVTMANGKCAWHDKCIQQSDKPSREEQTICIGGGLAVSIVRLFSSFLFYY